jgi:uncharacterized membrane protein YedE/YeeE
MTFESFVEAQSVLLWSAFGLAFIIGLVANKTNFCTMGAVSDMVNMGDYSRFRAWLLAIAVALVGVVVFEYFGMLSVDTTFPPYRDTRIIWIENLIGGFLFGIGMTLASGCGNKTLVRIGGGNIKSFMVLIVLGTFAFYMTNPFPGSDQTIYSILFYDWVSPLAISLEGKSDLGSLIAPDSAVTARLIAGLLIAVMLLVYIFRSADFRAGRDNVASGIIIGLVIFAAWFVSSNIHIDADGEDYTLVGYFDEWDMLADSDEGKPVMGRPLNTQSFTFVNPMAQTVGYTLSGFKKGILSFGIMSVLGVILGSLAWALLSRSFRIEWFASLKDFFMHFFGAISMGIGGTLALGCTFGQGISGISTLAVGSFIAFASIVFGSALTMKMQYYKMLYEEASWFDVLLTSLVELRLLPSSLRKLEAL